MRKRWQRWIGGLTAAAVGWFFLVMFAGCADMLLLMPSTAPVDAQGARQVLVPFEGGELEIWSARSPGAEFSEPEAFVLVFVGNAARAEHMASSEARQWGARAVEVWAVNHPGFGGSTGPARLSRLAPAALAAHDALAERADGRPIFANGTSMGSTMALHVGANRPVAGLVLRTPPPLRSIILRQYGWWNLWILAGPVAMAIPADLNATANARACTAPAVFVLFGADEVVPHRFQREVAEAYAGPTRIVASAASRHNDQLLPATRSDLNTALNWLWESASDGR